MFIDARRRFTGDLGNRRAAFDRARQELLAVWHSIISADFNRSEADDEIKATASAMRQLLDLELPNAA